MDFELDSHLRELEGATRAFAAARLRRGDTEHSAGGDTLVSRETFLACGGQGILGVTTPERYGGAGLGALAGAVVMEALAYGSENTGLAFSVAAHVYACMMPIAKFGNEEQREKLLPRLASGESVAAHAITEPESGSDALHLKTRAERRGDEYVLDGAKCFTTNAPIADVFVVHAATHPKGGFLGISAFLVPRDTPGLRVGKPYDKLGLRSSPTSDVYLERCVVPSSLRLGGEGAGAALFTYSMNWERTCLFAAYLGQMQRQMETALEYARARRQFGRSIGSFQAVSHRIVDMKLRLESARLLLHRAAWGLDRDPTDQVAPGLAKLAVSQAAIDSALDAIQIHGGTGVMTGAIERALRDAIPSRIFSGTNEIQKNNIARALGLSEDK